jgi:hypothetical protein
MATQTTTTQIDLSNYCVARNKGWRNEAYIGIFNFQNGQRAARESKTKDLAGQKVELVGPMNLTHVDVMFMSGLLRPLVTRQGLEETLRLVMSHHHYLDCAIREFGAHEHNRLAEKAKKDAREAKKGDWSAPIRFFVPEIGTAIRLTEDWTFRLHGESRNSPLLRALDIEWQRPQWRYHGGLTNKKVLPTVVDVTFKAGTILKIDRIYIRKGVKEYSSVTFHAVKGAQATYDGVDHVLKKAGARFWAKLSDVNKLNVEVDQATLAEN